MIANEEYLKLIKKDPGLRKFVNNMLIIEVVLFLIFIILCAVFEGRIL